jgi:hypothetical protein
LSTASRVIVYQFSRRHWPIHLQTPHALSHNTSYFDSGGAYGKRRTPTAVCGAK